MADDNIHPVFDRLLARADKEARLGQRARVLWLYGLSGSGKSTLANALERRLFAEGRTTVLLDGDNVRTGLNRGLGFSDDDRRENIRRIAEVSRLFIHAGVIALNSFITPTRALRDLAREIIGPADFVEIYVACSFEECARRDVKGLYAKAGAGGVAQFTGRDSAFEPPPDDGSAIVAHTEGVPFERTLDGLHAAIGPRIRA